MRTLIANARLVLAENETPVGGALLVEGDRIAAIVPGGGAMPADHVIDAGGQVVAPGIVDLGAFATDKPAFRFGGIVRAALMPDQAPVLDDPATVRFAAQRGKPDFWVHPLGAATRGLEGHQLAELALMRDAGARAVATGRRWISNASVMRRLMRDCAALDLTLVIHPEDADLTHHAVATEGEMATRLGLSAAPALAEALAVARDLMLAQDTGARIHFRQVTTAAAIDLLRGARARGMPVTGGITPAHLHLSEHALAGFRTFARLSPPLRSEDDRRAAIAAVADGTIDVIASGHDPRGPEDKRLPFADAAPGMAGAETLLALSLALVRDGHIHWNRLFAMLAANPARLLGIEGGRIAVGQPADLILIDPERRWIVDSGRMAASAGNTPFDRLPVEGRVLWLMKGGKLIG